MGTQRKTDTELSQCLESDCLEPRAVSRTGHVYPRCRRHHREGNYETNVRFKNAHPGYDAGYMRKWREANTERDAENNRRFKGNHGLEYFRETSRRHAERHPEACSRAHRRSRERHPEADAEYRRRVKENPVAAERVRELARQRYANDPGRALEYARKYRQANPERYHAIAKAFRNRHPDRVKETKRHRREALAGLPPYSRMDPWPTDCQCCGNPIDPIVPVRTPMSATEGHEPPIDWAEDHPEYDGPYVLRPEHFGCNSAKNKRPDWELPPRKPLASEPDPR